MNKEKEMVDVTFPPQSSIKLVKYAKGYGWEVKRYCDDLDQAFDDIVAMNKKLKEEYGQSE
jgi:hypothetical protein